MRSTGKNALMYGAGHGGVEAMLLLGLASINNIVNSTLINSGSLPGVLEGLDEATTQTVLEGVSQVLEGLDEATAQTVLEGVSQLWTAPSYLFFIGGFERIVAIGLHIALSVLVWRAVRDRAVRDGKASWYWAAFGGHFAVDFAAVILANYSIFATEAVVTLMTAVVIWYAARAYKEASAVEN